ncbi:MAG: lysophospholipid acyltransferase family protein [Steroidobacteraceae bacterium]
MPQNPPTDSFSFRSLALLPLRIAFSVYAALIFLIFGGAALLAALALPALARRRAATRRLARALLACSGMPVSVRGLQHLPSGQCVIVANHASYLDGPVFTAVLPARFAFVIKREMASVPLAGTFLRRIGAHFVERFDRRRGAADALRVLRSATRGHSLVFFPEGTFTTTPGLLRFHSGAFTTAVRAGCPVVPAVVRGTRIALSPRGGLPRPARIEVEILEPIEPPPGGRAAALLRDRARAAILAALREPDLGSPDPPSHVAPVASADLVQSMGDLSE